MQGQQALHYKPAITARAVQASKQCVCSTGDREYDAFVHKFGRRHRSLEEYRGRRQVFQDNARLIAEHNSGNSSHRSAQPAAALTQGVEGSRADSDAILHLHPQSTLLAGLVMPPIETPFFHLRLTS